MQIITGNFPELNIKLRRPTTIFMKTNDTGIMNLPCNQKHFLVLI